MDDAVWGLMLSAVVMPVVGGLLYKLTAAGAAGAVGRNALLGIRVPGTVLSDVAWRAGHAAALPAARATLIASVILGVVTAAIVYFSGEWGLACYLVSMAAIVGGALRCAVVADRAGRDAHDTTEG